jgi:hypothetical protein
MEYVLFSRRDPQLTCGIAWSTVVDDDVKEAVRRLEAGEEARARM